MGLLLPLLVAAWESKNAPLFSRRMQDGFDALTLLGIPFAFGSALCGVAVMTLIKSSLAPAGQVLAILGPTLSVVFIGSLFSYTIVAIGKQRVMMFAYAFVASITIIGYIIFIPMLGMWGAAIMSLVSEILIGSIAAVVVLRTTQWKPNLRLAGKSLLASLAMAMPLTLLLNAPAWISVPIGCAVYITILGALGGPSPKTFLRIFRPSTTVIDP
jgi:O-antigen/teichoic acid export membrane protein